MTTPPQDPDFGPPRSLSPAQRGDLPVTRPARPAPVTAWVVWDTGVEELIEGVADAWTDRAVHVRWHGPDDTPLAAWVWAGACQRRP